MVAAAPPRAPKWACLGVGLAVALAGAGEARASARLGGDRGPAPQQIEQPADCGDSGSMMGCSVKGGLTYTGAERRVPWTELPPASVRLRNVGGWPVCEFSGMCVRVRDCRDNNSGFLSGQVFPVAGTSTTGECGQLRDMTSAVECHGPVAYLPGTTLLVDTHLVNAHFSHVGSRVVQSHSLVRALRREGQGGEVDRIFMFKQSRYPSKSRPASSVLTQIVLAVLGPELAGLNSSVYKDDLVEKWGGVVCMERVMELRDIFEVKFASDADRASWRHFVNVEWNPVGRPVPPPACPENRVVVLFRSEGTDLREIRDYAALERGLRRVGICRYENATVGSRVSLREQAAVFQSYALFLSVHSSQLFNLVFAHHLAAVLELRPTPTFAATQAELQAWRRFPSSFCADASCDQAFNVSRGHGAPSLPDEGLRTHVDVDERVLARDLALLLTAQRDRMQRDGAGCVQGFVGCGA